MSVNPTEQKAWVLHQFGGPIEDWTFETIPTPTITQPLDILVQVKATALNPVDLKVQKGRKDGNTGGVKKLAEPRITGYDASGVVVAVGGNVNNFKVGDEVYYSGLISRNGTYQQFHLVDSRIVALKPKSLSFEDAAALPLTSITAYEGMKEEMNVQAGKRILIHGGAGGVASVAIQLAKHWGLTVIATASRPETEKWVRDLGADEVVNHRESLVEQFKKKNIAPVDYVYLTFTEEPVKEIAQIMNPCGHVVGINGDLTEKELPGLVAFFNKRISFHYEMMFARPLWNVEPERQGALLAEVAKLVDEGKVKSTVYKKLSWKSIHEALHIIDDRAPIGKIVLIVDENNN